MFVFVSVPALKPQKSLYNTSIPHHIIINTENCFSLDRENITTNTWSEHQFTRHIKYLIQGFPTSQLTQLLTSNRATTEPDKSKKEIHTETTKSLLKAVQQAKDSIWQPRNELAIAAQKAAGIYKKDKKPSSGHTPKRSRPNQQHSNATRQKTTLPPHTKKTLTTPLQNPDLPLHRPQISLTLPTTTLLPTQPQS